MSSVRVVHEALTTSHKLPSEHMNPQLLQKSHLLYLTQAVLLLYAINTTMKTVRSVTERRLTSASSTTDDHITDQNPSKNVTANTGSKTSHLQSIIPTELLLVIVSHLSPSSRALLALTCKRLWNDLLHLVVNQSSSSGDIDCPGLEMPRQTPPNLYARAMREPRNFQFERFEFLRLLEDDVFDKWVLCHDCFRLHPPHAFKIPSMKMLEGIRTKIRKVVGAPDSHRSCRSHIRVRRGFRIPNRSLSGIVDLCPCLHLTPEKLERSKLFDDRYRESEPEGNK